MEKMHFKFLSESSHKQNRFCLVRFCIKLAHEGQPSDGRSYKMYAACYELWPSSEKVLYSFPSCGHYFPDRRTHQLYQTRMYWTVNISRQTRTLVVSHRNKISRRNSENSILREMACSVVSFTRQSSVH